MPDQPGKRRRRKARLEGDSLWPGLDVQEKNCSALHTTADQYAKVISLSPLPPPPAPQAASVHGLRYIFEEKLPLWDRTLWAGAVFLGLLLTSTMVPPPSSYPQSWPFNPLSPPRSCPPSYSSSPCPWSLSQLNLPPTTSTRVPVSSSNLHPTSPIHQRFSNLLLTSTMVSLLQPGDLPPQVVQVYQGWQDSPTLTTIKTTAQDLTSIHFPAITLCRYSASASQLQPRPHSLTASQPHSLTASQLLSLTASQPLSLSASQPQLLSLSFSASLFHSLSEKA